MITRERVYGKEAAGLLRAVTMYGALYETQLCRLYPGKERVVKNLLTYFVRQKRIRYDNARALYTTAQADDTEIDSGMIAAFWVLLDFIEKVEYHTASDFPVKIAFFTDGNHYDIIHAASGNEFLINHAMGLRGETHGISGASSFLQSRRIVIVDDVKQIEKLRIPYTGGYCTVGRDGSTSYYKRE